MVQQDYGRDLQSTVDQQQLSQLLLRLSISIEGLVQSQKEMQAQTQLDNSLKFAAQMNPDNKYAFDQMYANSRTQVFNASILPTIQNIQGLTAQANQGYSQLMSNQAALDSWNATTSGVPPVTYANKQDMFDSANAFQKQYMSAAFPLMGSSAWKTYMSGSDIEPLTDRGAFSRSTNSPFIGNGLYGLEQHYIEYYKDNLQKAISNGNPDLNMIGNLYSYQKDMFENSQQMFLNRTVSSALGMPGLAMGRSEFEQGIMPSLTKFSDITNTDITSSIQLLKQLKEMHVIAADLNSGKTADVALGVDSAIRAIKSLSSLLNSTDIPTLMQAAQRVSTFGAGNYIQGMQNILGGTPGVVESTADRFNEVMGAVNNPFMQQYGYNRIGIEMALFNQRGTNTFGAYGDQDTNLFLGGASGASNKLSSLVGSVISNPSFMAAGAGGGNVFSGANTLADSISKNPYEAFIGWNQSRYNMMSKYSGEAGLRFIEYNMLPNASNYGLSKDQYLLALAGGNPEAVVAYRKYQEAKTGEMYDRRKALFDANQALDYMGLTNGLSEREISRMTNLTDVDDINWDYYGNQGYSGFGPVTRNVSNYFKSLYQSNRGRSLEDIATMASFIPVVGPIIGRGLEIGRDIYTGELAKTIRGFSYENKYTRDRWLGGSDYFNPDIEMRAGDNRMRSVDFTKGRNLLTAAQTTKTITESNLVTVLSSTTDIAVDLLETIDASETGGVTEGAVKVALLEATNRAMSDGSISGDDNRDLVDYIRKSPLQEVTRVISQTLSEDNPWMLLVQYATNPVMAQKKNRYRSKNNMMVSMLRKTGMSTEQINEEVNKGHAWGLAAAAGVGTVGLAAMVSAPYLAGALGLSGTGAAIGSATIAGGSEIFMGYDFVKNTVVDWGQETSQKAAFFFGNDFAYSKNDMMDFMTSNDDVFTREVRITIAYISGFLERAEDLVGYNNLESRQKEAIKIMWLNIYDVCARVYDAYYAQNKSATGNGKPALVLPDGNIREAVNAAYTSSVTRMREYGYLRNISNADEELRKAIVAVVATMLSPDSSLYKSIASRDASQRRNAKNALLTILNAESLRSGGLGHFTNFANTMLANNSAEGVVRFATEAVKVSNYSANKPTAEALATMLDSMGTKLTAGLTADDQETMENTLKSMGGVEGLVDKIKTAITTGDVSDLVGNAEFMKALGKPDSAVRKAVEGQLGTGISDMLINYKEGKLSSSQIKNEIESMAAQRMTENQKTVGVDIVRQQQLVQIIKGVLGALKNDNQTKQALESLGLA